MSSLFYFFKESLQGFTRNLSTTLGSILTVFLSLLLIGVFVLGGVMVDNVMESVENEISITVYIADDAPEEDIQKLEDFISNTEGVAGVSFTTKDQALENFSNTNSAEIIAQLDGNPLPASINVELSDPQSVTDVVAQIEGNTTFVSICDNPDDPSDSVKYGETTVERLLTLINYVRHIGFALVILLIFIALVFINNTIRLAILARRKEISIMRLVGASNGFIRGPFLMEGALHAIIGSLLAVGVLELLRRLVLPQLGNVLMWLPINIGSETFTIVYIALIVAGLIIGLIGSAFSMRRYLKV